MTMVTNVASSLKKALNSTAVSTPEETRDRKKKALSIVDTALEQFQQNLQAGVVQLDSSLDLERLVRCFMVLSGESDAHGNTVEDPEQPTQSVDTSKIAEILNEDDPMVQALFEKLYNGYNELNDVEE